jgi:dCMP deaminase
LADAEEKLKVICHAEANAIYNAARIGVALRGASIFVTKFPCLSCCNAIIQAGIARIYTHDKKYWNDDPLDGDNRHKRVVLKQSGIRIDAPFPGIRSGTANFFEAVEKGSGERQGNTRRRYS